MSYAYTYSIVNDFPDGAVNTEKLVTEIGASSIATSLDRVDTNPAGDDEDRIDVVFVAELSSGDKTTLDGDTTSPAGGLIAAHDNTPTFQEDPEITQFLDSNCTVTDQHTGIKGPFDVMQTLVNRREIFNDSDNPLHVSGHVPLIGASGSVTNLNTIHGKTGWHNQEVIQASYSRPRDMLIYYGWLNSFNYGTHAWNNEKVAQDMSRYGLLVFGDGIQNPSHGDYSNTSVIIPRIKALNPRALIFGYVATTDAYATFCTKVGQWVTLGVHGVFMDVAGYDQGTTTTNGRAAFNQKVDYVHGQSMLCFVNAWNSDHVLGTANDPSYPNSTWNPSLVESTLTYNDWLLVESFPINTTSYTDSGYEGYEPKAQWASRGVKVTGHRATYGINLAAAGLINNDNSGGQSLYDFGFVSSMMWSLEGYGTSDTGYGASSSTVTRWDRTDVTGMGVVYTINPSVQVDVGDADAYHAYREYASMKLDFSQSAQSSVITKYVPSGASSSMESFCGYDGTGEASLASSPSWTDVSLSAEHVKTSGMTHSGAEVTVNVAGRYEISGRYTVDGGNNSTSEGRLARDQGSGYAVVPGTIMDSNPNGDSVTVSFNVQLDVSSGDKFKLQACMTAGSGSLVANGSSLSIAQVQ